MGQNNRRLTAPHSRKNGPSGLTIGVVVDVNDPQGQGRVRVSCPALNDIPVESEIFNKTLIPWAMYLPAFGGISENGRGPDDSKSEGPVAYGDWKRPDTGDLAVVACIDGDPQYRVCIGSVHSQYMNHTLPRGRYIVGDDGDLDGPLTSTEHPIQPLYDNITTSFGGRKNFEWHTRGAEQQVSALPATMVDKVVSNVPDSVGVEITMPDGSKRIVNQGYQGKKSKVFAWVTPGFHAITMNDDPDGCRIKIQTTTGHQILLDDTNERIFVGTNSGEAWHEIDAKGNIDTYSALQISYHSKGNINVTSDSSINMLAKQNINMIAGGEIRMQSVGAFNVKSGTTLNLTSVGASNHFGGAVHIKGSGTTNIEGSSGVNVKSGGQVLVTGTAIHLNGPPAAGASSSGSSAKFAYAPSRIPSKLMSDGNPWARVSLDPSKTDNDSSSNAGVDYYDPSSMEYGYTDAQCNRIDLGVDLKRGERWKR